MVRTVSLWCTYVASMVAQCKCVGKGLVRDLQLYHGRLLFPLDYQPGKPPPLFVV